MTDDVEDDINWRETLRARVVKAISEAHEAAREWAEKLILPEAAATTQLYRARTHVIEQQLARLTAALHSEHQGSVAEKTLRELADYWEAVKRKVLE